MEYPPYRARMYPSQDRSHENPEQMRLTSIILTSIKTEPFSQRRGDGFFVDNSVETWKTRATINKYKLVLDNVLY